METLAITINSKAKRFLYFLENNAHLKITPFDAVVGKSLSKDEILKNNLATNDFYIIKNFLVMGQ